MLVESTYRGPSSARARTRGPLAEGAGAGRRRIAGRTREGVRVQHVPVLAHELVAALDPQPGQIAVDCTFGAGGHARLVAQRLGPAGTLVAIDRDPAAERCFAQVADEVPCATRFIRASYLDALYQLASEGLVADLIYFDLGMSSMQLEQAGRGFSYSHDDPLDMRMDSSQPLSALDIVATYDQRSLASIMREFGEERHAGAIARAIVRQREHAPIRTTLDLVATINGAIPTPARFGSGHPARRVFQALRIAVNDELGQLDGALPAAWGMLSDGGVLAAIAFHSLEDRRVKRFLVGLARGCICPPDLPVCVCGHEPEATLRSRRAVAPTAGEVAANPRAASAHLRAACKLPPSTGASDGRFQP